MLRRMGRRIRKIASSALSVRHPKHALRLFTYQCNIANSALSPTGNLPYTATKSDIQAHFASVSPVSVRLLTERDGGAKSKGVAFIEFANVSHMRTCLDRFHHTEFADKKTGAPRRINVELTAGGGGGGDARMEKVKEKNRKLNEERAKRIAKEEEAKKNGGVAKKEAAAVVDDREDAYVHPSRRAHVPGRRA